VLAGIAHDAAVKHVQRQMLHHLREHELAQVHPYLPRAFRPQDGPVPRRRRGSNRQLDAGSLSKRFSTTYHDRSAQRWDTTEANPRLIAWYAWIGPEIPIEGSVDIQEPLKVEMAP
jgi:hypothetical protein